jgi:hypothetical protein
MIVHCPSCSTRYRHQAVPESLLASAQCSECDEVFPLDTPRRRYVIVPTTGGERTRIGMDHPGLAEKIRQDGAEHSTSAVLNRATHMTPLVEEQTSASGIEIAQVDAAVETDIASAGPTEGAEPWTPASELEGQARTEPSPDGPVPSRKVAAHTEILVALAPACAGSGLAYYLAGGAAGSPWVPLALGGAVGLLVGWGCLRWMRRAD